MILSAQIIILIRSLETRLAAVEKLVRVLPPDRRDVPTITRKAKELVALRFQIPISQVDGPGRRGHQIKPRFIAIHLAKKFTAAGANEIGFLFNRNHSTIRYALRSVENWVTTYPIDRATIRDLENQMESLLTPPAPIHLPSGEGRVRGISSGSKSAIGYCLLAIVFLSSVLCPLSSVLSPL